MGVGVEVAGAAVHTHVQPEAEVRSPLPAAEIASYVPLARPASAGHALFAASYAFLAAAAVRQHAAAAASLSNQCDSAGCVCQAAEGAPPPSAGCFCPSAR